MHSDSTACLYALKGLNAELSKNGPLTASFCRHATATLLTQRLFETAAVINGPAQQEAATLCLNLLDNVARRVPRGTQTERSWALQLLAATAQTCSSADLLERAVSWGAQLSDAIKRANTSSAAAGEPKSSNNADGLNSSKSAMAASLAGAAVIQAACVAGTVLFNRLQQYIESPGVRREVTSIAPKLLSQLVPVLQSSQLSSTCRVVALQQLASLLRCVPTALRSAILAIECTLQEITLQAASDAAAAGSSSNRQVWEQVLAEAAVCVGLLPAVPGDAAAWSDLACRLLVSCHDILDYLLLGLENRPVDHQYRSYLKAAGTANKQQEGQQFKDQQGQQQSAAAGSAAAWLPALPWRQQQLLQQGLGSSRRQTLPAMLLLGACISSLQHMLQQPFAVPVPVPSYSSALLAARLLQFDAGSAVAAGAVPASTTMYQELLVMQPSLQHAGWQLLQLVIQVAGHQLQLQGMLLRLARQALRSVQLSGCSALQLRPAAVRCCMYNTAAQLLQVTGLAGVRSIAAEVIGCAVLELYGNRAVSGAGNGRVWVAGGSSNTANSRPHKRAKSSGEASGHGFDQFDPAASLASSSAAQDEASMLAHAADLTSQTVALWLLQQLLEIGGQLLPAEVRSHADAVVYHIAQTAAAAVTRVRQQPALSMAATAAGGSNDRTNGDGGDLYALQLAAYKALLASILVPRSHRPPFLSQALLLFRQGRSSSHAALAALCKDAAVCCEALLHPRATAINTVRQYQGMDALPAFTKPRMWSVVEAAAAYSRPPEQAPPAAAAATMGPNGPSSGGVAAQANGVVVQGQEQLLADRVPNAAQNALAAAHPGGTSTAGMVIGYPIQQQQSSCTAQPVVVQQQQQSTQPQLSQGADQHGLPEDAWAAKQAASIAEEAPAATHDVQMHGACAANGAGTGAQAVQATMQQMPQAIDFAAPITPVEGEAAAPKSVAGNGAAAAARAPEAMDPPHGAVAQGVQEAWARGAAAFQHESSDSEGPLPEIDSGGSSSEEED